MSAHLDALIAGCEAEQLHLSGAVQPFGALLALSPDGLQITHASANIDSRIDMPASAVIGAGTADTLPWLAPLVAAWLTKRKPGVHQLLHRVHATADGWLDALLVTGEDCILVELLATRDMAPLPVHRLQLPLLEAPGNPSEAEAYNAALLSAMHEVLGFDRIMLYRFHDDFSGEVIAERADNGLGSYLGLRFPASDIPAIARRLYLINPWRAIPDIQAASAPVLGPTPLDLTHSLLRSVSPVHLKYLDNMGVRASFSLPIKVAGQLWGLVACHHGSPLTPDPEACEVAGSLARNFAMGISIWNAQQRMQLLDSLKQRVELILHDIQTGTDLLDGLARQLPALLDLMAADGLLVALGTDFLSCGHVAGGEALNALDDWFTSRNDPIFMTDEIASERPDLAAAMAPLAGVAAFRLDRYRQHGPRGLRFYWFRREEPQEVAWAGNPDKPQAENASVPTLAPRRSFERWVEVRQGVSRPWSNQDRLHCTRLRFSLLQME
ncbi:MAG: bacteriophytochrome [Proteobacteria bacterium]|nr:bacteriophytochrome [Pseudomonadota bacterium]